jgi:hypothetical protein
VVELNRYVTGLYPTRTPVSTTQPRITIRRVAHRTGGLSPQILRGQPTISGVNHQR